VLRWNPAHEWVISKELAHTPLVSEDDFVAAQAITAVAMPEDGTTRTYALVGLLRCRLGNRRMESHWVYRRPGYRCRDGHTSAKSAAPNRPKNLYLREDHILALIAVHLDRIGQHDQPGHPTINSDPGLIAHFLRANNITVVCDTGSCPLEIRVISEDLPQCPGHHRRLGAVGQARVGVGVVVMSSHELRTGLPRNSRTHRQRQNRLASIPTGHPRSARHAHATRARHPQAHRASVSWDG
jgi:hypothetical protein